MVSEDKTTLYKQLHKLTALQSEQELENFLNLLWKTRKTGLSASDKSSVHLSLLKVPSLGDLDLVLACVRSLIRKCVHENLEGDGILKLLPHNLPLELQRMLLMSLQKYQSQWKQELSEEQHLLGSSGCLHRVNTDLPPPLSSFVSSEGCGSSWSRQVNPVPQSDGQHVGGPMSINVSHSSLVPLQNDVNPADGILPQLKSMAWTVDNKNKMPANRVAIITLKLQDFSKSPPTEIEVKFQLSRDTLDAMLRSMTYISEKLSSSVESASVPSQKRQRH
ncbi:uncharacterized protein LOC111403654 isoform X1 [Olea europaea var. sylvestris]|uniref:uncharacterized protein LOC111403654 isoform X1 n=1 Tax=Olea europaea var. sylvestris TaxID=158386 RepID=UPI000C1D2706|nr:uncharacterized protein LOC111403654 isoform X1 [Olea europaea var. sylvestris]XP_022888007.1 uncharacterized protein LOC111403654 isoform X1 [Olea europaea var. sylvestris]